jgi:hypothetical protein
MKKQYILTIAITISLVIISIIWFIFYKNYEINQKEFIFEKNKECLSYKDKMEKQFLNEHNNLKIDESFWDSSYTEKVEISRINKIDNYKIDKIFYNEWLNSCLFIVEYEESDTTIYNENNNETIISNNIDVYNYISQQKIEDISLWCNIFINWEFSNWKLKENELPPCADIDFKENWRKSYNEWQKNYN